MRLFSMLPSDTPRLPVWPFLLGDAVLLVTASIIAFSNPGPLSGGPLYAVIFCVTLGVVAAVTPYLANYARNQDDALDERQRALDALSQRIANSADQVSVAANGLNELVEMAHKYLKQAEHLPHKLQEKIAEFNQQLSNAQADEREELERELATLRTSEGDRLEATIDKVQKVVFELARIEAEAAKQVQTTTESLVRAEKAGEAGASRLQQGAALAAAAALEQWQHSVQTALRALEATLQSALVPLTEKAGVDAERKVTMALASIDERIEGALAELDRRIATLESIAQKPVVVQTAGETAAPRPPAPESDASMQEKTKESDVLPPEQIKQVEETHSVVEQAEIASPVVEPVPHKRARKSRKDAAHTQHSETATPDASQGVGDRMPADVATEKSSELSAAATPAEPPASESVDSMNTPAVIAAEIPSVEKAESPEASSDDEGTSSFEKTDTVTINPAPEAVAETALVPERAVADQEPGSSGEDALGTDRQGTDQQGTDRPGETAPVEQAISVDTEPVRAEEIVQNASPEIPEDIPAMVPPKPARRRQSASANEELQPSLGLVIDEPERDAFMQDSPEDSRLATSVSADGATRLIVTAYIGIGNRLYIRGDGPGLSAERGLPLQFVSIGKWRWETAEATAPVRIKLLKNDQQECPMLGEIVLEPGHQAEVTANF